MRCDAKSQAGAWGMSERLRQGWGARLVTVMRGGNAYDSCRADNRKSEKNGIDLWRMAQQAVRGAFQC